MTMHNFVILLLALMLWGCSATPSTEGEELPRDLTTLKKLQREKQDELNTIEDRLDEINALIAELDPNAEPPKRLVTVIPVERKDFKRFAKIQGAVESKDLVSVSSETGGRIANVRVVEGQSVRRGQLIARIDLESLRKQREELETSLQLAQDIYDRQARL